MFDYGADGNMKKYNQVRLICRLVMLKENEDTWAPSSEFVSSSIPSWQILTAHAQPFRGARDLAFCLKVPLDSLLVRASSEGSGKTARMRRLAWTFAARKGDNYQIRLTRSIWTNGFRELSQYVPFVHQKIENSSLLRVLMLPVLGNKLWKVPPESLDFPQPREIGMKSRL